MFEEEIILFTYNICLSMYKILSLKEKKIDTKLAQLNTSCFSVWGNIALSIFLSR